MEKVKLTKSQAEEIELIKRTGHPVYWKEDGWLIERSENLVGLSFQAYMNAIYKGYEVEPEFKVGDWVYVETPKKEFPNVYKIMNADGYSVNLDRLYGNHKKSEIRHATPQEIETEKTRRWWAKHDRDVWELKHNDALIDNTGCKREIDHVDSGGRRVKFKLLAGSTARSRYHLLEDIKGIYRVFCFAEDRKDI